MKKHHTRKILSNEGRYGFIATVMAIIVIICGVLVLMAYAWGEGAVLTLAMGYSPMSISSALAFIASGIILMNRSRRMSNADDSGHAIIPIVSYALVLLMGSTLLRNLLHGNANELITYIFEYDAISRSHYGGPSLMSASMFLLIGVVNIGNYFEFEGGGKVQQYMGVVVAIVGTIATLGYIAHIPLLYFSISNFGKPMSTLSALLFILLGVGFVLCGLHFKSSSQE